MGIDDPAERLGAIREQMDGIKSSKQAVAGDALAQLSGFAPPLLLALGSRVATRSARLNNRELYFGVTGDRDHAPDVDVLTKGIEADVERLLDRAELAPA